MTDPLTCKHRIISVGFNKTTEVFYHFCKSCGTPLDGRYLEGRLFKYDTDNDAWVCVSTGNTYATGNAYELKLTEGTA